VTPDEFRQLVSTHLDRPDDANRWSKHPGAVLYSSLESIRPSPYYVMGANPGGDSQEGAEIGDNLYAPPGSNHYADQCWDNHTAGECEHLDPVTRKLFPEYRKPLQKRMCDLLTAIGDQPSSIPCTNLVFGRSRRAAALANSVEWRERCWHVHRVLLDTIRPECILSLGTTAFSFLGDLSRQRPFRKDVPSLAWCAPLKDAFQPQDRQIFILAVPHPSNQGFATAGLRSDGYPTDLKQFIAAQDYRRLFS
jgi:hypothetical protein